MAITISGSTDTISAADGSLTIAGIQNVDQVTVGTGASVGSPATNVLTLGTNDTERLRIDSSGDVGIGTDNPSKPLQVHSDSSSAVLVTGATPQIRFNSNVGDGSDADRVILGRASGNDQFITGSVDGDAVLRSATSKKVMIGYGTTEIAQFNSSGLKFKTSGMGIDFSATADGSGTTTSELLADYEEGTFTGTIQNSDDSDTGYYVKIGNRVFWQIDINPITGSTATGQPTLTGLPFTSSSSKETVVGKVASGNAFTWSGYLVPWIGQNSTTYSFWGIISNSGWVAAGFVNGDVGTVRISGDYFVD